MAKRNYVYTEADRIAKREYYLRRREEKLAKAAEHRAAHRQQNRDYAKEYYRRNKEKHRKTCDAWFKRHPGKRSQYQIRHRYGLTKEQWTALLANQNGLCPICKSSLNEVADGRSGTGQIAVDHIADTKIVRGILCGLCNRGIGCLRHDSERLRNAIAYLEAFDGVTSHPDAGTPARTAAEGSSC